MTRAEFDELATMWWALPLCVFLAACDIYWPE